MLLEKYYHSFKELLFEETDNKTQNEIALGLSHKAMQHLVDGLRDIESALQYCEDEEMREVLDSIRLSLLSDNGRQEGFAAEHSDRYDNVINVLGDMLDNKSQDNYNFNLNGSRT
jgi:hypothetical protein